MERDSFFVATKVHALDKYLVGSHACASAMNLKTGVPRQWPPWHEALTKLQQLLAAGREVNQIRVQGMMCQKA